MLAGRAARGHTTVPSVPWTRVTCVSAAGAQLRASLRLASALSPAAASVFNRYKAALSAGGELALPFTTDKVVGFLADQVIGLRRIFVADKMRAPAGGGTSQEFLDGVVQSRELGSLALLHLPRVVTSARARSVAR
jgi:hypothetical protein